MTTTTEKTFRADLESPERISRFFLRRRRRRRRRRRLHDVKVETFAIFTADDQNSVRIKNGQRQKKLKRSSLLGFLFIAGAQIWQFWYNLVTSVSWCSLVG